MKKCSELKFGFTDAQWYLRNPNDPLSEFFRKSFYKSIHLERTVNPDLYFLLGDKGTGKTAYAVYASLFMKSEYTADCEFFDKNDFTRFIEIAAMLSIEKSQYSSMWVFVFLILFVQKLDMRHPITDDQTLLHLLNAIKSINLGGYARTISQCIETASMIDALFDSFAHGADLKLSAQVLAGAKPSFKMNRIIDLAVEGLARLSQSLQFALFIDGLDVSARRGELPGLFERGLQYLQFNMGPQRHSASPDCAVAENCHPPSPRYF